MNNLTTVAPIELTKDCAQNAKTIYAFCRSVTPQFYNKQSSVEMKAQCIAIMALIKDIKPDILKKMLELAVSSYKNARNSNIFFDINYILTFYDKAWNMSHPVGFNFLVGVEGHVYLWARLIDLDDDGNLPPGSPIWRDERHLR